MMRSTTRGFERYYNPKVGDAIRLDTNTNVLGSNPAAMEFLKKGIDGLDGYPNTYSDGLRDALADLYGLERENFVAGSGSDEMIDVCFKTFTEWGDSCVTPVPSYSLYNYFIEMNGGKAVNVDLDENFQLDVDAMLKPKSKVMIMPSPNNPTGNTFRTKDIEEILSRYDGIVIVDEAYGEYAKESMVKRVNEFDNLIVMRTFSKAYAMAALRIGYAIAGKSVADMMSAVKIPYSLNKISEMAAMAAVKDQDFVRRSVEMVEKERPYLADGLRKLGFETFPSDSNFILARSPIDHAELVSGLKKKGILIRDFGSKRRTENCVRPTIGTRELNDLLLAKIKEVLDGC
ncbi:MAG: histidinol-phosphate transaminase [Candidatus Methanomethylophilaceae archaeon]|nr:histidinol-phosphate transaminase [Candidatus Methanomethylophilaceae archaeon]